LWDFAIIGDLLDFNCGGLLDRVVFFVVANTLL
jgi:hypothetical protein